MVRSASGSVKRKSGFILEVLGVRDVVVEIQPPGAPLSSPQTGQVDGCSPAALAELGKNTAYQLARR